MYEFIEDIVKNIDKTKIDYAYLIGSYASNNHNEFSDVDIICGLKEGFSSYSDNKYIGKKYISINYDSVSDILRNYTEPYKYIMGNSSIKDMVVLYDPSSFLKDFREKCMNIDYLNEFTDKINNYVNKQSIDWIEEVNKAVSGYIYYNPTKMLEGLHGLTYGMLNVLSISEGIVRSRQGLLPTLEKYFSNKKVYKLLENAFGVIEMDIKERVYSGLLLYIEIIEIIKYRFNDKTINNIELVMNNIKKVINKV